MSLTATPNGGEAAIGSTTGPADSGVTTTPFSACLHPAPGLASPPAARPAQASTMAAARAEDITALLTWLGGVARPETAETPTARPEENTDSATVMADDPLPTPTLSMGPLPTPPALLPATITATAVTAGETDASLPMSMPLPRAAQGADAVAAPGVEISSALSADPPSPPLMPVVPTVVTPPVQPASATPLPLSPPPVMLQQPQWPEQLGEHIQWRLADGVQEARIEVHPPALGPIEVQLQLDDGSLKVHLSASHAETRALLQGELPRLREVLQQSGLTLAEAAVGRDPGRSPPPPPPRSARRGETGVSESGEVGDTSSTWLRRRGLIDDYA
jgi:flagellar hook-length control protein FliK